MARVRPDLSKLYITLFLTWVVSPNLNAQGGAGLGLQGAFLRGDCNTDRKVDIADPIVVLEALFRGTKPILCGDACDADDSGGVLDLTDAVYLLEFIFLHVDRPPPPPHPDLGFDPTPDDSIGCGDYPAEESLVSFRIGIHNGAGRPPSFDLPENGVVREAGRELRLVASGNLSGGGQINLTSRVRWRATDAGVASIRGGDPLVVKAVSPGECEIQADFSGIAARPLRLIVEAGPDPGDGELVSSLSQYGITWEFDGQHRVGRFVTGDYWVVGPVKVLSVSPAPGGGRNGSMLNPPSQTESGYDSRTPYYDGALGVRYPITIRPGDSLVSTVSNSRSSVEDLLGFQTSYGHVRSAAVLTCVAAPVGPTFFRPPAAGHEKPLFDSREIRWELLPNLEPTSGSLVVRDSSGQTPCAQYARYFERPWIVHVKDWVGRQVHPSENMPNYHREVYNVIADAALLLLCDYPDRENLLIGFLQVGIDMHYAGKQGHADSSMHKWPVLLTGLLLGVDEMAFTRYGSYRTDTMSYYPHQKRNSTVSQIVPPDQGWTGAKVLWRQKSSEGWEHEHLHPTEWDLVTAGTGGKQREAYRRSNSYTWPAVALAARIMGAGDNWNHPAFFEYVDRWMTEPDEENMAYIEDLWDTKLYIKGATAGSNFVERMWARYRPLY